MGHVGTGYDEHPRPLAPGPRTPLFNRIRNRPSHVTACLKPHVEHLDGNDLEISLEILNERKLDFEGMFPEMGERIFLDARGPAQDGRGKLFVNCHLTEGSFPRA